MPVEESRQEIKRRMSALLKTAEVPPKAMAALYLVLRTALRLIGGMMGDEGVFLVFFSLLTSLLAVVLDAGFVLYCITIRRGERAGYLTLFDGFDSALKIALLHIAKTVLLVLWYMLFLLAGSTLVALIAVAAPEAMILILPAMIFSVIPLLVVYYRYSFCLFNLLDNPDIGILEAIRMSKRQTLGRKKGLLVLDLSYAPWYILQGIPGFIYNAAISGQLQDRMGGVTYTADSFLDQLWKAVGALDGTAFGIPATVWMAGIAIWTLAVSVFWLPHYHCVLLEYFEAAKRATGIGEGAAPWEREEFYQK